MLIVLDMNNEKINTIDTVSTPVMTMPKIEDIFSSSEISFDNLNNIFQDRLCPYAAKGISSPVKEYFCNSF
jgi:hypothetical protein